MRPEDEERTLKFVDILGFKAITEAYEVRVEDYGPDEKGFTGSGTTEMPNRVNRFNNVVDTCVLEESFRGGVSAMLLSDCAFLVFDNSLRAAITATEMMRMFMRRGVPVRMGIGKGTFYDIEYSTNTTHGSMMVSKSRFVGTAVVRAHAAELCGGKGMRIFLHSSMESDLSSIQKRVLPMTLAKPLNGVQ
jgi:hypothetical protein